MIHICFGLHDGDGKYSKFVGATMASIFENTCAPVTIHILHDDTLTADNRDKFSYLAGRYAQHVEFHNVEELCPNEINFLREKLADKIKLRFSIGAFYRLLIKNIFGDGKIIYLDADIIVNLDITELWRKNLKNFPLASVPEIAATSKFMITDKFLLNAGVVNKENYFCSGVILFNLSKLDENFFYDGVQFLVDNPACESVDQDILNAFFSENYLKLNQKFDSFVAAERQINETVANKIYHYSGKSAGFNQNDEFNRLWLKYFARTPWFNLDVLKNLNAAFNKNFDQYVMRFQQIMRICAQCRRAFFVESHNVDVLRKIFNIRDDERIIELRDEDSLKELLTTMREQHGQTLFFICHEDYDVIGMLLLQNGFVEFQDFVNGTDFMTPNQCGVMRPDHDLIRAL